VISTQHNHRDIFANIFNDLAAHSLNNEKYQVLKKQADEEVKPLFSSREDLQVEFGPFGKIRFPYYSMGNVTSLNLFDIDELIMFGFYYSKRERYRKVLDLGANLGLHTLIMSKCGFEVTSFEPDPNHFEILERNVRNNLLSKEPKLVKAAVSDKSGIAKFIRVHGNTTSSHLEGMKPGAYGELSKFDVNTIDIAGLISEVDFIKMDVEGHEGILINRLAETGFKSADVMLEIGNETNRKIVFDVLKKCSLNCFTQKNGWKSVDTISQLPSNYKEGSVFLSAKLRSPW
jgi:FkbM family methyltransferase